VKNSMSAKETNKKLEALSAKTGISKAAIIRLCVARSLDDVANDILKRKN